MRPGTAAWSATRAEGIERRLRESLYLGFEALRGRPVGACIARLRAWERLDRSAFRALCRERLATALRRALVEVPLYSEGPWRAALGRHPPERIESWPVLERDVVQRDRPRLLARHRPPGTFHRASSGASGRPLAVACDPAAAAWSRASEYRAGLWHGIPVGARALKLAGSRHSVLERIRNGRVWDARELSDRHLDQAAHWLLEHRPDVVTGLASAVTRLARHLRAHYPHAPRTLCRWAKLGGEQVFPFQRREIGRHLGARVLDFYGCTEAGAVSAECPAGALHVHAEIVHVEIARDGEPVPDGEEGDILVTSLVNRAMPLVRCRVGDRGVLSHEPCACGLPHPVLTRLASRAADLFVAADGRLVHGSELAHALDALLARAPRGTVREVLFRQRDARHWDVLVEARDGLDERLAGALEALVRRTCGAACRVRVERVDAVPRDRSGEFRYYARVPAPGR